MKFTISKSILAEALAISVKAVSVSKAVPAMCCILFQIADDHIRFCSANGEVFINRKVEIQPCGFSASVAINADSLVLLVKTLPAGPIDFELSETVEQNIYNVKITAGDFSCSFVSVDDTGFPPEPAVADTRITLPSSDLLAGVNKTMFAVAADNLSMDFRGVHCFISNGMVRLTATDTMKLSTFSYEASGITQDIDIILPVAFLKILQGVPMDEQIYISVSDGAIRILANEDTIITSVLIAATYKDAQRIIPVGQKSIVEIERDQLLSCLNRVSQFANPFIRTVRFKLAENELTITATNPDYREDAVEVLKCSYTGDNMELALHSIWLSDILSKLKSKLVSIGLIDQTRAVVIKEDQTEFTEKRNLMMIIPHVIS